MPEKMWNILVGKMCGCLLTNAGTGHLISDQHSGGHAGGSQQQKRANRDEHVPENAERAREKPETKVTGIHSGREGKVQAVTEEHRRHKTVQHAWLSVSCWQRSSFFQEDKGL